MTANLLALLLVVFVGPSLTWLAARGGVLFWQRRQARR